MVQPVTSIALKGIALAMGVVMIAVSTINSLTNGSAIAMLGLGLAALALESMQRRIS